MENLREVWQTYKKTKSLVLREKLILEYAPLVKYVAGRLAVHVGKYVELDDLIGYGVFGLIDAVDKFDVNKGVKFETYASVRIRGTIIDSIRKLDWIPRTLRQKNKEYEQLCMTLEIELGREPTEPEIAQKLNMTLEEARKLIRKSTVLSLISLDDYLEQGHEKGSFLTASEMQETPEQHYDRQELQTMLTQVIEKLPEQQKLVVSLYYFEDLTLKEISGIMGVSESRVSQIHSKAIMRMQGKLGKFKSVLFS
ncbi:MAG: FliA/WhiG family RNA polymerase sigma factor [Defluviitaleaceae bacterium]|nr:FliA/WhiG family RNA polymerase sigma factor [Defluviitaleaceae bacterium]